MLTPDPTPAAIEHNETSKRAFAAAKRRLQQEMRRIKKRFPMLRCTVLVAHPDGQRGTDQQLFSDLNPRSVHQQLVTMAAVMEQATTMRPHYQPPAPPPEAS